MNTLLEAEHLTKVFAQRGKEPFKAVDDVSFSLQAGETLGIVGESGSGKSTLAKMITRLTDITDGTLKFQGKDITKLKQSQLRDVYGNIQMVFQNPAGSFDPRRTLGDGIGESLRNRGMKKADIAIRVKELLEQCGLEEELAKRYPHEVSGGQCQRAAIARALAVEPKVLICDEATSSLDVTIQKQIIELLEELKDTHGLSFIFICHNLALVQSFCDKVLFCMTEKWWRAGSRMILSMSRKRRIQRSWWMQYLSKISTEESPAGQDCTATIGELPLEAPHRSRRILRAGFFFLKFPCKIFHKSRKICKMGMGKYPPGELVIPVDSGTIGFSSKAENA